MVIVVYAAVGAALASAYAAALAWNANLYLSSSAGSATLLHFLRSVTLFGVLVALASAGAHPLLAAVLAFACAHAVIVARAWRRA